ncbi:hypothetical protein JCM3766R1_000023 [Sporobolomyces carnicolor]
MSAPLRSRHSTTGPSGRTTPTRAPGGSGSGLGRVPGTPLGRVLAAEGFAVRSSSSPRKIRHKSMPDKARDWFSNRVLALETSIQDVSFDEVGYPLACAFNSIHFVVRLPHFYSSLPPISSLWTSSSSSSSMTPSRYLREAAQLDADARLTALTTATSSSSTWFATGWIGWTLSVALVLVSVANTLYLASRTRKYQLMLRKDPLSSPNAKAATLRFSREAAPPRKRPLWSRATRHVLSKLGLGGTASSPTVPEREGGGPRTFPIQELHVWTPEYVLWSLRFFTGYPPPIALMYHFLSSSTFVPFLLIGPCIVFLFVSVVHLYSTLVQDRQILSTETMHEYNSTFVYPTVFRQKRDAAVSTDELEFTEWKQKKKREHEIDSPEMTTTTSLARRTGGGLGGTPSRRTGSKSRHSEYLA